MSGDNAPPPPHPVELMLAFVALFCIVTAVRPIVSMAIKHRALVAAHWPEIAIVAGVCVVAWAWAENYSDQERILMVVGVAAITGGALALVRPRRFR